jgi:hypothetical protein
MKTISALLCLWSIPVAALSAETLRIYHIGNSLTWDSNPALTSLSLSNAGYTVQQGYHIACSRGLTRIESEPDYVCVPPPEPYGTWTNALANYDWDVITLQAYPGGSGLTEVAATRKIIEIALAGNRNRNCKFFLLLAWPTQSESNTFSELMMTPFEGDDASVFLSSGFLDYWYQQIVSIFPDLDIRTIPTGLVLATMDQKLSEINIGQYTNTYALYRDPYHMTSAGGHVAGTTMLCAVSGMRPQDQIFPAGYAGFVTTIDSRLVDLTYDVSWYTLSADPRTKITTTPEIRLIFNATGNAYECSFVGKLYHSMDLKNWNQVNDAKSPYRFGVSHQGEYFRSER